jgi:hypothetical protein
MHPHLIYPKGVVPMSKVNESDLDQIRAQIESALAPLSKTGLTLKVGHCKFDRQNGNFTFNLEGLVQGGLTKEEGAYETLRSVRPKLPPLHSTFLLEGKTFEIVGANTTLTKVNAKSNDKRYTVTIEAVEEAVNSKKKG